MIFALRRTWRSSLENVCLTKKSLCLIWVENRKQNLKSLEGRGVREKAGEFSCIYAFRLPFLGNNELTGIFQTSKVWNFTRGSTESKSLILKMRKWGGGSEENETCGKQTPITHICIPGYFLIHHPV